MADIGLMAGPGDWSPLKISRCPFWRAKNFGGEYIFFLKWLFEGKIFSKVGFFSIVSWLGNSAPLKGIRALWKFPNLHHFFKISWGRTPLPLQVIFFGLCTLSWLVPLKDPGSALGILLAADPGFKLTGHWAREVYITSLSQKFWISSFEHK